MRMRGIVMSLGSYFLGPTVCFGIALEIDVSCQSLEECNILVEAHVTKDGPFFRWQSYHHASIHLPNLIGHEVTRKIGLYFFGPMLRTHHTLDRALKVVRHYRHAEHEQRRAWITQRVDLAVQGHCQILESA